MGNHVLLISKKENNMIAKFAFNSINFQINVLHQPESKIDYFILILIVYSFRAYDVMTVLAVPSLKFCLIKLCIKKPKFGNNGNVS